jgi:PAS domain-containing protein
MQTIKQQLKKKSYKPVGADFIDLFWGESWTYIKTVVDIVREPILILDKDFRVMAANEAFYRTFQVDPKDTEKKLVYNLGNGQWDIPALRKLLEEILPKNTFFKGFEVSHNFPIIGKKVMILNARQIHKTGTASELFPPIILLAMEDITEMIVVAETIANHTKKLDLKLMARTSKIEDIIKKLKKEIENIKK